MTPKKKKLYNRLRANRKKFDGAEKLGEIAYAKGKAITDCPYPYDFRARNGSVSRKIRTLWLDEYKKARRAGVRRLGQVKG